MARNSNKTTLNTMNDYEKEIFQWLEDAGLNPVHHNMAVRIANGTGRCIGVWPSKKSGAKTRR